MNTLSAVPILPAAWASQGAPKTVASSHRRCTMWVGRDESAARPCTSNTRLPALPPVAAVFDPMWPRPQTDPGAKS